MSCRFDIYNKKNGRSRNKKESHRITLIYTNRASAQVDTVANTSRHSVGRRLHNVAITVGAIGGVVDDGDRIARLRQRRRAQRDAAVRQHLVAAHGDAGSVRRLGRQLLLRRLRARAHARHGRRGRAAGHARRARARAVRAVQAVRRARARHARSRVKVGRLCWPAISGYFYSQLHHITYQVTRVFNREISCGSLLELQTKIHFVSKPDSNTLICQNPMRKIKFSLRYVLPCRPARFVRLT